MPAREHHYCSLQHLIPASCPAVVLPEAAACLRQYLLASAVCRAASAAHHSSLAVAFMHSCLPVSALVLAEKSCIHCLPGCNGAVHQHNTMTASSRGAG